MKQLIAVLNQQGALVGTRTGKPKDGEVVLPANFDLPLDGSYVHREGAFWPLGHGFPKPGARPAVTEQLALYQVIEAMGTKAPTEARRWADWYSAEMRGRDEERATAHEKRGSR